MENVAVAALLEILSKLKDTEPMYRGLAPCTIVKGFTESEFKAVIDLIAKYILNREYGYVDTDSFD